MGQERIKAVVRGAIQGAEFCLFVRRLAAGLGLDGCVSNAPQGVCIEAEGPRAQLNQFLLRLQNEAPARAAIQGLEFSFLDEAGYRSFDVRPGGGGGNAHFLPDVAVCAECLAEIFEPGNRRHLYPFTHCAHCGPRYSIMESLPYHRSNTSMRHFTMCPACEGEYHDPRRRRFHAQAIACPECGPQLALWDAAGKTLAERHDALRDAAAAVRDGEILALKSVGGFKLIVDARNDDAVRRLRERKGRGEKPFAVMFPSLAMLRGDCAAGDFEARLLASPEAPIVLLRRHGGAAQLAESVAPGNPNLGALLPHSPLHHLLLRELDFPVVATSGSLDGEPACIHEADALQRLGHGADVFLVHDRPIARAAEDSVAQVVLEREMMLRRARGYTPMPVHIGDEWADAPATPAQPHYARLLACMADNELDGPVLGVCWGGGGQGTDGAMWGGEFLLVDGWRVSPPFDRVAHLRPFKLPGGEAARQQPRRAALGLLWEIFGGKLFEREDLAAARRPFTQVELGLIRQMLAKDVNAPPTSSASRLFDAAASLLGLRQRARFGGQAAMDMEFAADRGVESTYPFDLTGEEPQAADWEPMIRQMLGDLRRGQPVGRVAAAFHNTLAEIILAVARRTGVARVVLTGGCFRNRYLLERTVCRLREHAFRPYWPQRIPPDDSGIAVGRALAAARAAAVLDEPLEPCYA